jgi:acetyl-CoA carboxylase biotin carboxyl carrier protein
MTLERIKELLDLMANAAIAELEVEEQGTRIRIIRQSVLPMDGLHPLGLVEQRPAARQPPAPASSSPETPTQTIVAAPLFGVFHRRASPDAAPFVEVGSVVAAGQQLGIIEAMTVFNAVHAAGPGRVAAILAENGQEVAPGQPLFRID